MTIGSAFSPGLDRAAAAGHRTTRADYPTGAAGIALSMATVAAKIREGRLDPDVIGWARGVLRAAGLDGRQGPSVRAQAQAILDAYRAVAIYTPDAVGAEVVQSAAATLCLRPGLCLNGGDCFPMGTLLLRDDYALVPIEEIKAGERIWGYDRWTTVRKQWSTGLKTIDTIILNNGSHVWLTPEHHVFVAECGHMHEESWPKYCCVPMSERTIRRVKVSEVAPGAVITRPERIPFGKTEYADVDRAYIEGLYLSEGWCEAESNRFAISGRDGHRKEHVKHEVKSICERLGISTYWHKNYIRLTDAEWSEKLSRRGTKARFKNAETLDLGEGAAGALLRGIMSDSTANSQGNGRTFSTTSTMLMVQARVLHRMFGISTGVRHMTPGQHGGLGEHPMWRMQVWGGSDERNEKLLRVKEIECATGKTRCFDITTEDGFVYLPQHDMTVSNCDDGVVAVGSALMGVGLEARLVKQVFAGAGQEHVLLQVKDERGLWLYVDPSLKLPVGEATRASSESYMDPMTTGSAEIVTLGRARVGRVGLGVGITWPSMVLSYYKLWTGYVMGTARALQACGAAPPQSGSNMTQALWTAQFQNYADAIVTSWNLHASSSDYELMINAPEWLQDYQRTVMRVAEFYQPIARQNCPDAPLPALPRIENQSVVVSAIENAEILGHGTLQLLAIGAGGVLETAAAGGKFVAATTNKALDTVGSITPWIAAAAIFVATAYSLSKIIELDKAARPRANAKP